MAGGPGSARSEHRERPKSPAEKRPGYLHPIPNVACPFHTIHADHLGPFIKTRSGKSSILTVIDAFTKFILI
jgi:hypothetical protein